MRPTVLLLAAALLAAGCIEELGNDAPRLGRLERDCVVPLPAALEAWGAPVSIEYADHSLWIWASVTLAGGAGRANVAAATTSIDAACAGELSLVADGAELPTSILRLDDAELRENATRTDGRRIELAATGGFAQGGRGTLYYEKRLAGPGPLDSEVVGMGVCVIESPGGLCQRARPAVHPGEPTLLFLGRRVPNRGAFVDGDYAYLAGCLHVAAFQDPCNLARVRPALAADPGSYEYRGFDDWIGDPWNSATMLDSAGAVTPGRNPYLGRYTLVSTNIWQSTIEIRAAATPWGNPVLADTLFAAVPPKSLWFISGGIEHAALRAEGGRTIAVTYYTDGEAAPGLHLAAYRFAEELQGG